MTAPPEGTGNFARTRCLTAKREGVFDHAVLNLHYDLDSGRELFGSLGFKIAPRSYHSLGSMNHLIVFQTNYLELIGLDSANPNRRKELLDWPVGLNGLVIGSDDIDLTGARLRSNNLPVLEPRVFNRRVEIGGVEQEARFRTIHVDPSLFPASRLYFCEHQTPDLVWNAAFMQHPNTAHSLARLLVAADDPHREAGRLTQVVGAKLGRGAAVAIGGIVIEFESTQSLFRRHGDNFYLEGALPRVVGMSIGLRSLSSLKASVDSRWTGKLIEADDHRMIVPAAKCFGVMLELVESNASVT